MTQPELNTHIINIQNQYSDFVADDYLARLKRGKVCKEVELAMVVVRKYLAAIYRYQPFEDTITYAYSFEITREGEDNITITIDIGTETFTYTGTGDLETINIALQIAIEADTVYGFDTYIDEGILYVWSISGSLTFATTTTVSTSDADEATIEETNMENTWCTILDLFNCLTTEKLCTMINHSCTLLEECNC